MHYLQSYQRYQRNEKCTRISESLVTKTQIPSQIHPIPGLELRRSPFQVLTSPLLLNFSDEACTHHAMPQLLKVQ